MAKKITVIGAGNVGGCAALRMAQDNLGDIMLIDVVSGLARGKACDLEDARALVQTPYSITGSADIRDLKDSDIIVVTAGLARKPGMTREDLLKKNAEILKGICEQITVLAPQAVVIIVTNPLDVMTRYALRITGFKPNRLFGMGVSLDASRFANLISLKTGVPVTQIQACVIASHGEAMLPMPRFTLVNGKPLAELLPQAEIDELIKRTVERGKEIVSFLGTGSAFVAPSAAIAELVRAIVRDQSATIGVSTLLCGEYGVNDVCAGVPCLINKNGIGKIIQLTLNTQEAQQFKTSCESIRALGGLIG
ncbi:MAG TPA: malate dehydrogenase [Candidatus Omnitrophota bacterium]|nr:malate dehydrogenase [Candidatus Omnitrophota bacterium]HRZ15097.1 malate dehydrogenase [Candidatus Omnitrophota bacterium]